MKIFAFNLLSCQDQVLQEATRLTMLRLMNKLMKWFSFFCHAMISQSCIKDLYNPHLATR